MLKNMLKRIPFVRSFWEKYQNYIRIEQRLTYLEQRVHNFRWYAAEQAAEYLVGAQLEGDYCEFGVYKGDTFAHFMRYHSIFPDMRYFAFDSFEGLPEPKGIDVENGYTSNFHKGEFAINEPIFIANLESKGLPLEKIITVKGWFDHTLNNETASKHNLKKISCAWIDCDLYESTVPVLNFLTEKLSVGSMLIFDDWKVYRNLADKGQQKACREWLDANPGLALNEIFDFSHNGKVFTVAKIPA